MNVDLANRIETLAGLKPAIEAALSACKVPGAAVAIIYDGEIAHSEGFGVRNIISQAALTPRTVFPIASTSKAMNATLLAMLVEEGLLSWDAPLRTYLPEFRMADPVATEQATLRDFVSMRTGLPRHDMVWLGGEMSRCELLERLPYLEPAAQFREKYQYNNITTTISGHVAEVVTGKTWEALLQERLFNPLGMTNTHFGVPSQDEIVTPYLQSAEGSIVEKENLPCEFMAPCGGSIHSTVEDMARWLMFNLNNGEVAGKQIIQPDNLHEVWSPQVVPGEATEFYSRYSTYGLGWRIDHFQGNLRISHTGYLSDIESSAVFFPDLGLGLATFSNNGPTWLSWFIAEYCAHYIMTGEHGDYMGERTKRYYKSIEQNQKRLKELEPHTTTKTARPVGDYAGRFGHAGYGQISIRACGDNIEFCRGNMILPMQYVGDDIWAFEETNRLPAHLENPFDRGRGIKFVTNRDGAIERLMFAPDLAMPATAFVRVNDGERDDQ